jgi:hypothetical protein
VGRGREEFCNDLAKKKGGRLSDAEETQRWDLYVKCLTGARMKIPMNGIWVTLGVADAAADLKRGLDRFNLR